MSLMHRHHWHAGGIALALLASLTAGTAYAQATPSGTAAAPGKAKSAASRGPDTNLPPGVTQNPTQPNSATDAQGRSYKRSGVGTWTNYDESKANPYPLPDPLVLKNGQAVKDAETWWTQRRPEILKDFQTEIYGRIPENTPKVTWEVTATDANAARGAAIMKTIVGHIDNSRYPSAHPSINITLYTPSKAAGPVPVIVSVVAGPGGYGAPRAGAGQIGAPTRAAARQPSLSTPGHGLGIRDDGGGADSERLCRRIDVRHHRPGIRGQAAKAR